MIEYGYYFVDAMRSLLPSVPSQCQVVNGSCYSHQDRKAYRLDQSLKKWNGIYQAYCKLMLM